MTHKELHSALLYVILLCHHYTSLRLALCWLHHGPISLNLPLARLCTVRLVTCAALTSRELLRGALDGSTSSLEFERPASSVEWLDLAARAPQHLSPVHRTFVQPLRSPRLSLEMPAILHQTLRSAFAFITRSSTLKRPSLSFGR